jgi:hypothetical protein
MRYLEILFILIETYKTVKRQKTIEVLCLHIYSQFIVYRVHVAITYFLQRHTSSHRYMVIVII